MGKYCPLTGKECFGADCAMFLDDTSECSFVTLARAVNFFVDYDWQVTAVSNMEVIPPFNEDDNETMSTTPE